MERARHSIARLMSARLKVLKLGSESANPKNNGIWIRETTEIPRGRTNLTPDERLEAGLKVLHPLLVELGQLHH